MEKLINISEKLFNLFLNKYKYVEFSRCKSRRGIKIECKSIENIVFDEALQ